MATPWQPLIPRVRVVVYSLPDMGTIAGCGALPEAWNCPAGDNRRCHGHINISLITVYLGPGAGCGRSAAKAGILSHHFGASARPSSAPSTAASLRDDMASFSNNRST